MGLRSERAKVCIFHLKHPLVLSLCVVANDLHIVTECNAWVRVWHYDVLKVRSVARN